MSATHGGPPHGAEFLIEAARIGGEVGRDLSTVDWAATEVGHPDDWPTSLQVALRIMLTSRFSMWLAWGPELTFFCNDAYRRATLGVKYPWALGRSAREVWAEIWPDIGPRIATVLDTGNATWDVALPLFLERSGYPEETYHTFSYSPLHDDDGVTAGMLCVVSEDTERVLAQRRMELAQVLVDPGETIGTEAELCAHLARHLSEDLRTLPFSLVYLANPAGELHLAVAAGIEPGRPAAPRVLAPDDAVWPVGRALAEGRVTVSDLPQRFASLPTGAWDRAPTAALLTPLPAQAGEGVAGVFIAALNPYRPADPGNAGLIELLASQIAAAIASVRAYSYQRRRAEELAELDAAKTAFFTNVSHEFRTPLTLMLGPVDDLLTDDIDKLTPRQHERLTVVQRNGHRLLRLVNNLLDFSRLEAGRMSAVHEPTELGAATAELAAMFHSAYDAAGLSLTLDTDPSGTTAYVDREMWAKIVGNLLSNALKFTFSGGVRVEVRDAGPEAVELSVTDTGVGVPAEDQPHVFSRFHRSRNTRSRTHEGTGIGLALVADLAALHGGTATLRSRPGDGTTVTVRIAKGVDHLPADAIREIHREHSTDAALRQAASFVAETERWFERTEVAEPAAAGAAPFARTVLVVDDNADMREYIAGLLRPHYAVRTAVDGQAALDAARSDPPDLVLTDVMMPNLDGFGLLSALRADRRTALIPLILLSARAGEGAAVEGLEAGADDYLVKPFSAAELLARVHANLELARLRSQAVSWREVLMATIQDAMQIIDAEGYLVEVNDAFRELVGFPVVLPQAKPHPWWPDPETDPDDWAQVAAAHQAIRDNPSGRFTVPFRHADGSRLWVDVMYGSLVDPQTGQRLVMGTFRDVTARTRLAERAATLTRVTTRLAEITDVDTVLADGARELQAAIAASSVRLALVGEDGSLRAVESLTAPDARAAAQLRKVAAGRALQVETTETGLVTGIGAPVSGEDLGATVWLEVDPPRRMTTEDHHHVAQLCASISHAVLRARAYDVQRTVALTLQRSLLGPSDMPIGFAARYSPAVLPLEVGGDWYDVVELEDDKVAVVVGDCIGKGLAAATVMGQLRSASRALLLQAKGPAEVLAALDDFAALTPNAECTSVFCAVIDQCCGHIEYAAAGHPPAVLVHADQTIELLSEAHSVPLATVAGVERTQASATLRTGSVLAMYTDGLVERRREHLDNGIDRLTAAVAVAMRLEDEDAMAAEILQRSLPANGHTDDVALLLYRHRSPAPFHALLAPDASELAVARAALREWMATVGVAEADATAVLIAAGEACANAIEHGYGFAGDRNVEMRACIAAGALNLLVRDEGVWKTPTDSGGTRGRGRRLMERLMDRAVIDSGPAGTLVRLRKELDRAV